MCLAVLAAPVVWAQSDAETADDESQWQQESSAQGNDSAADEGFAADTEGEAEFASDDEIDSNEWSDESAEPADDWDQAAPDETGDWAMEPDPEDVDTNAPTEPETAPPEAPASSDNRSPPGESMESAWARAKNCDTGAALRLPPELLDRTEREIMGDGKGAVMRADGREVLITRWVALWDVLRYHFGGDGNNVFNLPNLEPLNADAADGQVYAICMAGRYLDVDKDAIDKDATFRETCLLERQASGRSDDCPAREDTTGNPARDPNPGDADEFPPVEPDSSASDEAPLKWESQSPPGESIDAALARVGTCTMGVAVQVPAAVFGRNGNLLPADGRLLELGPNTALYSLLGTHFGGDGVRTFALPDLTGLETVDGRKYGICTMGVFPQGDGGSGGSEIARDLQRLEKRAKARSSGG